MSQFVGSYHSDETAMTYSVREVDGRLRLAWPRAYDLLLVAVVRTGRAHADGGYGQAEHC